MGMAKYRNGFQLTLHEESLNLPFQWKEPRLIFVNSMSDLFHQSVPTNFIIKVFDVMNQVPRHTFQLLTKRPSRVCQLNKKLKWTPNIWMGTSIEMEHWLHRLDALKKTGAYIKFLSLEPLLGPLPNLSLEGIDWVIVGGESGPGARTMEIDWVRDIRDNCATSQVPFFFKQWVGFSKNVPVALWTEEHGMNFLHSKVRCKLPVMK